MCIYYFAQRTQLLKKKETVRTDVLELQYVFAKVNRTVSKSSKGCNVFTRLILLFIATASSAVLLV